MKVVVYGAGSIGCYLGAVLHKQGVNVCLLGRPRIKDAIEANGGFRLTDYQGRDEIISNVPFATTPDVLADADVVLVTLKCTAMPSATEEIAQNCGKKALIIALQNGVGAPESLQSALPEFRIYPGIVPFNVVQNDSCHFHRATDGALHFPLQELLMPLKKAYEEYGINCELHRDIAAVIWGKLQLNLNNAINALSNIPLKLQLEQRGYRLVLARCQSELLALCKHKGIKLAELTTVPPRLLPTILRLPDWVFKRIAQKMIAIDPAARSSMWEDMQAQRQTEIDFLNGAVVALAEAAALTAPANKVVAQLIREYQQNEEIPSLSATQLLKLMDKNVQ